MRVTKLLVFCFVTLIAMATGAPRRNKPGRSGERKRQRNPESNKNNLTTVLPPRTDEEESEDDLRAEFLRMDGNGDHLISLKEFKKAKGKSLTSVFESADRDDSGTVTWEELVRYREIQAPPRVECDKHAMTVCGSRFSDDLREQEEVTRRDDPKPSTTGLFCTALQAYVNCIGLERNLCEVLEGYAQRIKKTSLAYRSADICPEMDVSLLTPRDSERRQRPDRGEGTQSRGTRTANERTSNEECLVDAFSSCHDDLYDALLTDPGDCTLGNYRQCLSQSTERCPDKERAKGVISGLKYIERVHRQEDMCVILSSPSVLPVTTALVEPIAAPCDRLVLERCGNKFAQDLREQEEILQRASERPSSTGLFCTALQDYVTCIGEERAHCEALNEYAQRMKKTSQAYRSAEICPEMDVSTLTVRHSERRQRTDRGERTQRAANERTISNDDCLIDAFSSCHDDLYDALGISSRGCTLVKKYRTCLSKSTKRCRDKQRVKGIISGLKYIRKVHKQEDMCVLQT